MVGLQELGGVDLVVGLALAGLDQQLFRLTVQTVGEVDVDLGYRVVLVGLAVGGRRRQRGVVLRRGEAGGSRRPRRPRGPRGRGRRRAARRRIGGRSIGRPCRELVGDRRVGSHASGGLRVQLGLQALRLLVDELDLTVLETGNLLVLSATAHQQQAETEKTDRARSGNAQS